LAGDATLKLMSVFAPFRPVAAIDPLLTLGAHCIVRPMSAYAEVDDVITEWVKATGSKLFTEWADAPARYFHIPGDPPFECFQVSVRPPEEGRTSVLSQRGSGNARNHHSRNSTQRHARGWSARGRDRSLLHRTISAHRLMAASLMGHVVKSPGYQDEVSKAVR
jgi:hypothetical protein